MKLLDSLRFRIATLFQRSLMNAEMEEELRSHDVASSPTIAESNAAFSETGSK
jgi:hypothetical protein